MLLLGLATAQATPVDEVLSTELDRALEVFEAQPEKPHYIALVVEDRQESALSARDGTLGSASEQHERWLDVDLRVGTPELDSTHQLRGFSSLEGDSRSQLGVAIEDGEPALRHAVWGELDRSYREAAERIVIVRSNQRVKVEEESPAPDFTLRESPTVDKREVPPLAYDEKAWTETLIALSRILDDSDTVHSSSATLHASRSVKYFVDTEGTRLVHGALHLRLGLLAATTADDGDEVRVYRSWDVHDPERLPDAEAVEASAKEIVERLEALAASPRGEPFTGPVILAGKASGVFFHEVFGHRVEGHRQKREYEGKTFVEYVGKPILPDFIDVYDDPTIAERAGEQLNGHYAYDDEGTPAARAELVDDGLFRGFLMGRSPIPGFTETNGHGRRMSGRAPVSRMGNTIIEASQTVSADTLRAMLLKEVKAQGLEYGILVEEIEGGFTLTGREMPNAFNVRASASWRIYADGRPDELVRGIDLVGTPLVAFSNLVAAGDDAEVFNGHCGAESGWVPVSAVAPSLLFRQLEFQLKEKGQERPPLLSKPEIADDGATDGGAR